MRLLEPLNGCVVLHVVLLQFAIIQKLSDLKTHSILNILPSNTESDDVINNVIFTACIRNAFSSAVQRFMAPDLEIRHKWNPVIQQQKLTNQNHFSPRKVSISKPLFFNAHENEAAKFTVFHAVACGPGRSDNVYLQLKVVFCC